METVPHCATKKTHLTWVSRPKIMLFTLCFHIQTSHNKWAVERQSSATKINLSSRLRLSLKTNRWVLSILRRELTNQETQWILNLLQPTTQSNLHKASKSPIFSQVQRLATSSHLIRALSNISSRCQIASIRLRMLHKALMWHPSESACQAHNLQPASSQVGGSSQIKIRDPMISVCKLPRRKSSIVQSRS